MKLSKRIPELIHTNTHQVNDEEIERQRKRQFRLDKSLVVLACDS